LAALAQDQTTDVIFMMGGYPAPAAATVSWTEDGGTEKAQGLIMTATVAAMIAVVEVKTVAEPALKTAGAFCGGVKGDGRTIHRLLVDKKSESYFGYDMVVESGEMGIGYRVSFKALGNLEEMRSPCGPGTPLKLMPPPRYPPPQRVHLGERVALDVLVSADGQQKVVDYLKFSPAGDPPPVTARSAPRDMTVDDERPAVTLGSFSRCAFFVNGKKSTARIGFGTGAGGVLWLYVPDHGRYILSLSPHPDFAKAGEIRDNTIFVQDGDQRYELRLADPIAGSAAAWNLYVLHDPHYGPRPAQADAVILGWGRMEILMPR
jgi:hypothetical protein